MNDIIQHFAEIGIKKLQERVLAIVKNGEGLSEVIAEIKKETDALGRGICLEIIKSLDKSIKKDSGRKKDWHVERREDEKTIITKLGTIAYKRTYYCSKDKKRYCHLVDEILGIKAHERIDEEVHAELAEVGAEVSYRKSGKLACEAEISGQTVMKSVRSLENLKLEKFPIGKKEIETLYVEADEDHIALQSGKSAMPRLVYVHEGIEQQGKRRNLKSPYYLASLRGTPGELWQEVYEYIEDNYVIDKIQQIYLSGDGAAWIKQGLNYLPKARFVLDKYHMAKYVTKATAHMREYASKIWYCLKEADLDELGLVFNDLHIATESESKRNEIKDSWEYFKNNWDGIKVQEEEYERIVGCSAEGHNSHILAARMSSRPMGWSKDGADKMARLRAFKANNGKVIGFIRAQKKEEKLYTITKKIMKETSQGLKLRVNEKVCNLEIFKIGKLTGLYKALKAI
ncbi:MAG: ISLre2 family transposase [Clostridia bacterium]|nr:ISLre2 family transposase [Clostridia bacterium]